MKGTTTALLICIALFVGCDARKENGQATSGSPSGATSRPIVKGSGVIRGQVKLTGFTPSNRMLDVKCEHQGKVPDETVVMAPAGELQNVVVFMREAPHAGPTTRPAATLDQVQCRYVPHVLAVEVGQELIVKSSDATLHNVHTRSDANQPLNFGMVGKGQRSVRFNRAEFIRVKCDVHPWMSAHLAVFDHPYFAVTDEAGKFEIEGVPAGSYTLVAWHEKFGELEETIQIDDAGKAETSFTYKPPANE